MFDSGRGGTTILAAVKKRLPDEEYLYIADTKNCPYGEKSEEELYRLVASNVERLRDWGAKIIVVACNTATVKCIRRLREEYPEIEFVGTEPAVRVAMRLGARKILVLATPNTIESERLQALVDSGEGMQVELKACPGLAETIERCCGMVNGEISDEVGLIDGRISDEDGLIDAKLNELLVKDDSYDVVVLGCTHYPLIKEQIGRFYPKARMVDSSEGVAKRVEKLVKGS